MTPILAAAHCLRECNVSGAEELLKAAANDPFSKESAASLADATAIVLAKWPGALYAPSSENANKRVKSLPTKLPPRVQREWDILRACNKKEEAQTEAFFRRAQARALKHLAIHPSAFFDKLSEQMIEIISSFFDLREMANASRCSTQFNYRLSLVNPRIWKAVSRTFSLDESYWPSYSKAQACANFSKLQQINRTFAACVAENSPLKAKFTEYSKCQDLQFKSPDTRMAFKETTLATIGVIVKNSPRPPSAQPLYFNACMNNKSAKNFFGYESSIAAFVEMFFISGERGDVSTLEIVAEVVNGVRGDDCSESPIGLANCYKVKTLECFGALELIAKKGTLPTSFMDNAHDPTWNYWVLPEVLNYIPEERGKGFFHNLAERGMKVSLKSLEHVVKYGPIYLIEPIMGLIKEKPESDLVHMLFSHWGSYNKIHSAMRIKTLIKAIDLLHVDLDYYAYNNEQQSLIFTCCAEFKSEELMNKITSIGILPDNEDHSDKRNSICHAMALNYPLDVIAFMMKYGAKPVGLGVRNEIQYYSEDPEVRRELTTLLYPKGGSGETR